MNACFAVSLFINASSANNLLNNASSTFKCLASTASETICLLSTDAAFNSAAVIELAAILSAVMEPLTSKFPETSINLVIALIESGLATNILEIVSPLTYLPTPS